MSIDSDVIRGHVDTIILKTLTTGEKYGYEIIKEIEQKSKGTYELKQPTLYSCLKRLESQGLISGFTKNSDIGGKRHYYKLTKKGRESYENSMQQWFNSRSIIDSLMGSKPTTLVMDNEDEKQPAEPLPDKIEESQSEIPETIQESTPLDESKQAQMIIDESSSITQEEPETRDFVNENLDETDVALLGDYYKTDENQIDLFSATEQNIDFVPEENNELDAFDNLDPQDKIEDETETVNTFKNYEGIDINKYRGDNKDNYFEQLSYGEVDEDSINNIPFPHPTDNLNDDIEKTENASSFKSFNFFTDYSKLVNDENEENEGIEAENYLNDENEPFTFGFHPSTEENDDEDNDERLNFGFGTSEENDDDIYMPERFDSVSDIDELDEESEINNHPDISIYGEDTFENHEDYTDYNHNEEEYQSPSEIESFEETYGDFVPGPDLKPYNLGGFSEPEHKEKLNQLSSYTKTNYESYPINSQYVEPDPSEAKTIDELSEDLTGVGVSFHLYSKPEKEPLKDKKYLLVNKIKFVSSWIAFAIMSILLTATYFIANSIGYNDLNLVSTALPASTYYLTAGAVLLAFPLVYTIIFLINKTKKVKPNYSAIISFIFAMLFFIVCLNIIYTLNILNGFTKFSQTDYNHLLWLLPAVISLLIVVQSLIYSLLFKTRRFTA